MNGTTPPLVPTVTFDFEGESFTAVADHMMIVRYERFSGQSFAYMMLHLDRVNTIGEMPKLSELGYLVQAMLGEHHPEIGLDVAMKMGAHPEVLEHISVAMGAAMPSKKEATQSPLVKAAKAPRPPKKSGTGKR